jgi:hypothetical protein
MPFILMSKYGGDSHSEFEKIMLNHLSSHLRILVSEKLQTIIFSAGKPAHVSGPRNDDLAGLGAHGAGACFCPALSLPAVSSSMSRHKLGEELGSDLFN